METEKILEYAYQKFDEGCYDEALDAFVLIYSKGYEREGILENIYACYMSGNEDIFRASYEKYGCDRGIAYDDCTFDFIPYQDGVYYIFDKEQAVFCGKFSLSELEQVAQTDALKTVEFSAAAVELDGNWQYKQAILADAKNRKTYAVCIDMNRGMSFLKIPELEPYLKNIMMFSDRVSMQEYFHQNTSVYLPKIIYGDEPDFSAIFDQEHAYRLTSEGRNTENVLLTIAIPTANRGYLLPKRLENLLKMTYDAEIEIAISKNGTRFYEEEYKKIAEITDARVNYYDHRKDVMPRLNWHYAVQMSHGKYVLLVSDEDDVILEALEHYFRLLTEYNSLSMMRVRTEVQGRSICEREYARKGLEAFLCAFLRQNYLSGLIVKRDLFLRANLLELECFKDNVFYYFYPHEWWCAMLSQLGDVMFEPVSLIAEGNSVLTKEIQMWRDHGMLGDDEGTVGKSAFPQYATYQARLEQFVAQVDFVKWFCGERMEWRIPALQCVVNKLTYLFQLARCWDYDTENFEHWVDEYVTCCVNMTDTEITDVRQQVELLQSIETGARALLYYHQVMLEKVPEMALGE